MDHYEYLHKTYLKSKQKIYSPLAPKGYFEAGTVMVIKEWQKNLVMQINFNDKTLFEIVNKP